MYDPVSEAREWFEDAKRDYRDAEESIRRNGNYIGAYFLLSSSCRKNN